MAGRFDFILDFLTVDHFKKVKEEALKEIPPSLGRITYYDEKKGIIQGDIGGEDGEIHDFEWSFDSHIVSLLNTEIKPRLREVIRELRYGAPNEAKLHSNSETHEILNRLILDLEERQSLLSKSGFSLIGTEKSIRNIIKELKAYKTELRKDEIWKGKSSKGNKFRGYKFTHSRIGDTTALTTLLWQFLLRRKLVENKDEKAFLSLFEEKWNDNTIKWLGSPKEFYSFYDALFNPLFKSEEAYIALGSYKRRLPTLLNCFDVGDPNSKVKIDNKGIKKHNSKPKENPLNKALRNLIEDQFI